MSFQDLKVAGVVQIKDDILYILHCFYHDSQEEHLTYLPGLFHKSCPTLSEGTFKFPN